MKSRDNSFKKRRAAEPADATPDLWENPAGTLGFEFVEYTAPDTAELAVIFEALGLRPIARHRSKAVTLYRQGQINFIVNAEPESAAQAFARAHGPSACAMAFKVRDAAKAYERALAAGAKPAFTRVGPMELSIPAIEGVGGSLIYLVDQRRPFTIYDIDFEFVAEPDWPTGNDAGLVEIDHLTHNVETGQTQRWIDYYARIFNFREMQNFDIEGTKTQSSVRAAVDPSGRIRIPISESADEGSQIQEFIRQYRGEGIQHIALSTNDIYSTIDKLRANGVPFTPPPPDTYYDMLTQRIGPHREDVDALKARGILVDGAAGRLLLQIFTGTMIGPIFFEIIQRKGDEGFGAGNVKALYESVERDEARKRAAER
jgi:4-hydroxyphenylpyruvate dioxygenase